MQLTFAYYNHSNLVPCVTSEVSLGMQWACPTKEGESWPYSLEERVAHLFPALVKTLARPYLISVPTYWWGISFPGCSEVLFVP